MNRAEPNGAHHALMQDLDGVVARYAMMPAIERVAVTAQFLGQLVAEVPAHYSPQAVMQAVSRNLTAGNETAAAKLAGALAVSEPDAPRG